MAEEDKKNFSLDLLGTKPIAEATNTAITKTFEGIEGFLKSVCMPALDEVGLLFRDKVRSWRLNNILRILEKAKDKVKFEEGQLQIQAHPRVALAIVEHGSVNDKDEIQEMWAGLFASSCTRTGQEDENLIFVDLLKQMTVAEARILKYACENSRKVLFENGLLSGDELVVDGHSLLEIAGIDEIHRLDIVLDHMRSLNLIGGAEDFGGFNLYDNSLEAEISPTSFGLNVYVKCQGHNCAPSLYWKDNIVTYAEILMEEEAEEKREAEEGL